MKLNLLPTNVSKANTAAAGMIFGGLLALVGAVGAVGGILWSQNELRNAKDAAVAMQKPAADALATAQQAETQIAVATVITTNRQLAMEMIAHNEDYVALYNKVRNYIPAYYRVTNLSAAPVGEDAQVTVVGQLQTFSQYADLAIALWKIPGVLNVTRQGYVVNLPQVPPLTEGDQRGTPILPGEEPLPSDPLERLDALVARAAAAPQGFQNVGGFGSGDELNARGPMPGWSTVTMTILVDDDIRTPDPRATIAANTGGGAAAPAAGFGAAPGAAAPIGGRGRDDD